MTKSSPASWNSSLSNSNIYELEAEICAALANPVRLQILDILAQGEKTNSQLLEILEIPKANLSQHLNVLKDAGIVKSRKEGLFQYVSLGVPHIREACALIKRVLYEKLSEHDRVASEIKRELAPNRATRK